MSDDNKPAPGDTVYRASSTPAYHEAGVYFWIVTGKVTRCGQWVEAIGCRGVLRHPLTGSWHLRKVDAEASVADELEATGRAYIAQAQQLREAARQEVAPPLSPRCQPADHPPPPRTEPRPGPASHPGPAHGRAEPQESRAFEKIQGWD